MVKWAGGGQPRAKDAEMRARNEGEIHSQRGTWWITVLGMVSGIVAAPAIIFTAHLAPPVPTWLPVAVVIGAGLYLAFRRRHPFTAVGIGLIIGALLYGGFLLVAMATLGEGLKGFD